MKIYKLLKNMVEPLPDDLQERVAEHLREFIADLEVRSHPLP